MPHKLNDDRRHKFAKAKYRVTNWAEYMRVYHSIRKQHGIASACPLHTPGVGRSQLLLLPEEVDDYDGPGNPARFIDAVASSRLKPASARSSQRKVAATARD